ncbi:type IV conjugative transfer system lipoprotein TraV [Arsenophonus nasoniae]|uniref:Type IV conjugative transfer system lipoprotein TraV n=1 Tax=Arsenophonus nasoniae TaxID=638 RepID=A0ABY8NWR8_9GAMM|nr:type IV conjugative transfer system lipoprotein TraV [Arsenophonus nasoniae]WGM08837.1 type IV conjugative transfer system lipoprotein TraV [Arsenophonus nasoniae]
MMLKYRIGLISGIVLLSGCAGMNSEFEFGKPAKDSGYWMSEADEMTNTASYSVAQHKGEAVKSAKGFTLSAYRLIQLNPMHTAVTFLTERAISANNPNSMKVKSPASRWLTNNFTAQSPAACPASPCLGEVTTPSRQAERVTRAWIAPYVSPDEVVHTGEVVYFVTTPSTWANVEKV